MNVKMCMDVCVLCACVCLQNLECWFRPTYSCRWCGLSCCSWWRLWWHNGECCLPLSLPTLRISPAVDDARWFLNQLKCKFLWIKLFQDKGTHTHTQTPLNSKAVIDNVVEAQLKKTPRKGIERRGVGTGVFYGESVLNCFPKLPTHP